jgi:hypothetical protein
MSRFTALIVAACFAWSAQAAETGPVTEVFACTLKSGKAMADFDKAVGFWQTQMDSIPGGDEYFAATLVPFRADTEGVDVFWLGSSNNLNAWAKNSATYTASAEGRAAQARFDDVAECASGLYFTAALHEGLPAPTADNKTSVIEAYQCTLNDGRTMANAEHANATWLAYIDAVKATNPELVKFSAYMMQPWLADTPFDLVYLIVNDDMQDFGKINTAAMTTSAGQAVQAEFDEAMSCAGGLFNGTVIRQPAPRAQ